MDSLKPCPFCGCGAVLCDEEDYEWGGYFVSCSMCSAHNHGETKPEAIAAWNTRHTTAMEGQS